MEATYDVWIAGEISFPDSKLAEWRKSPLDAGAFVEAPEVFGGSLAANGASPRDDARGGDGTLGVSVGSWIDDAIRYEPAGKTHFLGFREEDDRFVVRAILEATTYESHRLPIASMFRVASLFGGTGELLLLSPKPAPPFGYRVIAGPTGSRVDVLAAGEIEGVSRRLRTKLEEARPKSGARAIPASPRL